jgi:FMN-dependent oxidoreductase (nitrilotriacetate monooxygenase family)
MSTGKRQLRLGLFVRPCGHHIASWRHPRAHADAGVNFQRFVEMAQTAERGCLDMLFSADTQSALTAEGGGLDRQHYVTWLESFSLMSALSGHTRNIGLAATTSTSFEAPYALARRFATLDHISGGRAGWNVVTSGNPTEAHNFGLERHIEKAQRYKRAREFTQVVTGLWDSWDDDAFIRDREKGVFFDIAKMHYLDHVGEHFKVRGPLNVARTPQGRPVVIQAGASEEGKELAAETAEVVFSASSDLSGAKQFYADLKGRMDRFGRHPDTLKILPGIAITVAPSLAQAQEKHEELQELIQPEIGLGLLSRRMGFDLHGYPLDGPLPELPPNKLVGTRSDMMVALAKKENLTIRQLYKMFAAARGHFSVIGTPSQVADVMQAWLEEKACDGFNILPPIFPMGLDDFVDLAVPELQRRGLFRTRYEGKTLRDNLGLERPRSRYASGS